MAGQNPAISQILIRSSCCYVEIGVGIPKSVLPAGAVNGEVSISGAHFSLDES